MGTIDRLSEEEKESLYGLPYYIALLIASADGFIDESEIKKAILIISNQSTEQKNRDLSEYLDVVNDDVEDKLKIILAAAPKKAHERNLYFSKKIADTNVVLSKLDKNFVILLHQNLKNMATQVAKASGGILGYGSIGKEESKLLGLNLLTIPQ